MSDKVNKRSRSSTPCSPPKRSFKLEPTTPTYAPGIPMYFDNQEDDEDREVDNKQSKEKNIRYRCPFRREEDGMGCTQQGTVRDEILNHFYRHHFDRICSGKVFEENLNCFFKNCYETFSTHDKLVKHMHNHGGSESSMYYIKFLIDSLEKEKNDEVRELKLEKRNDYSELEKEMENLKKDFKTKEDKLRDDLKYYRKKADASKKTIEEHLNSFNDMKNQNEILIRKNEDLEDTLLKSKGSESKLREEKSELRGKLSLQKENCSLANARLEKMRKKCSNFGPNSESNLLKKCSRLEKQLETARRRIKEKDALLKEKNDKITDLELAPGSDDEPSTINGEYVESDNDSD